MYVFGYGSLIWNPGFEFQTSELAEIKNYKRSFSMWSIHHRGTVKRPGLVLALEKCNGHSCKGVVFRVSPDNYTYCQLTLDEQAKIIAEAEGGRGRNDEYLFSTEKKLTELGVSSVDLRYLVQQVKKIKS